MITRRLVPTVAACLVAALMLAGAASAWSWPLRGAVLRAFSFGDDPYAGGQHRGVDVEGAAGESVLAPASGTVSYVGTVPTNGRTVTILTSDGYAVTLTHLGETAVSKGAFVTEGDRVGSAGSSGTPEHAAPYVHLGIRTASEPEGYLDPLRFLPVRPVAAPMDPAPGVVSDGAPVAVTVAPPAPAEAPAPPSSPTAADPIGAPPPATESSPVREQPSAATGAPVPITGSASPAPQPRPPVAAVPVPPTPSVAPARESSVPGPASPPDMAVHPTSSNPAGDAVPVPPASGDAPLRDVLAPPAAPAEEPELGGLVRDAPVLPASTTPVERARRSATDEPSVPAWISLTPTARQPESDTPSSGSIRGADRPPDTRPVALDERFGADSIGRGGSVTEVTAPATTDASVQPRPTRPRAAGRAIALVELGDRSDGLGAFRGGGVFLAGLGLLVAAATAAARGARRIDRHGPTHRFDPLLGSTLGSAR